MDIKETELEDVAEDRVQQQDHVIMVINLRFS
jgi:hypothetical protein